MNSNHLILTLSFVLVIAVGVLFAMTDNGNISAAFALGAISTLIIVATGWSLSMIQQAQAIRAQQESFTANALENEKISQAQFRTQATAIGAQNKIVAQLQADNTRIRREVTSGPIVQPALSFGDEIFDELDN